jgi:GcrA cell cycle regulator
MSWTDDRIATLKQLWSDGMSASLIAATLGEVTRNAVIGKVRRLGLAGRATTSRRCCPARPRSAPLAQARPRKARSQSLSRKLQTSRPFRTPPPRSRSVLPELGPAPERPVTVQTLTALTCNWPIGDPKTPAFHFCGRGKPLLKAYCAHHAAIACA